MSTATTDANGNCLGGVMQGVSAGLPARLGELAITITTGHTMTYQLINANAVAKLPDGSCPPGALLTTQEVCVKIPVLPGITTGSGGGFIQMFPGAPPK